MHAVPGNDTAQANRTTLDLEGDRTLVITRTFNGPARIVFDAWTRPELVRRWWAPRSLGVVMTTCDADVRVGGTYRYGMSVRGGEEMAFTGRYVEVTPPARLVYTQVFEPMAHLGEATVSMTFDERGGRTFVVSREAYPTAEARRAVLESGMETGMRETMDQLDALVAGLN